MLKNRKILFFLLTGGMLLGGCGKNTKTQQIEEQELILPEQANYKIAVAEFGDYSKTTKSGASLAYPVRAKLSPKEDNIRLEKILVSKGDEVRKGDILATFQMEEESVSLEELTIALTRAEEKLIKGQEKFKEEITNDRQEAEEVSGHKKRLAQLSIEKQEIAQEQFVYQTEQEILKLQKKLEDLEERKKNSVIKAPFDGIVDDVRNFDAGDRVDRNDVIVSMHSPDTYLLEVTDTLGELRYNMEVNVEADFGGEKQNYQGVVVSAPNILPGKMSREPVFIKLEEELVFKKKWGTLSCNADVEEMEHILLIPRKAVHKERDKTYVYVLEDDTVKKRFVSLGLGNMESYWVLDGLKEGQQVILD